MRKEEITPDVTEESTIFRQHESSESLRQKEKEDRRKARQQLKKEMAERHNTSS